MPPPPESERRSREPDSRPSAGLEMALGLFGRRWLRQVGLGAGFGWRALPRSGSFADLPLVTLPTNGRIENDLDATSLHWPVERTMQA
ncbi:hypothetical protein [Thalassospira sp.]|uniref:hypothetical protein n=1 Tax=Thalassospira sp. TaxID=1912094 RepID=UPI0025CDAD46|nr:hypothetical protein [Thalassospira sp.]